MDPVDFKDSKSYKYERGRKFGVQSSGTLRELSRFRRECLREPTVLIVENESSGPFVSRPLSVNKHRRWESIEQAKELEQQGEEDIVVVEQINPVYDGRLGSILKSTRNREFRPRTQRQYWRYTMQNDDANKDNEDVVVVDVTKAKTVSKSARKRAEQRAEANALREESFIDDGTEVWFVDSSNVMNKKQAHTQHRNHGQNRDYNFRTGRDRRKDREREIAHGNF